MLRLPAILLLPFVLGACALFGQPEATPTLTPRPVTLTPVATRMPLPTVTTAAVAPGEALTRHEVHVTFNRARQEAQVEQRVRYVNRSPAPLTGLLLLVEANHPEGSVTIEAVRDGPSPLAFTLDRRRLTVQLARALQPGATVQLTLDFRLELPPMVDGGHRGWLGYNGRQTNLGNWLPVVAPRRAGAWLAPAEAPVGEHALQEPADWRVALFIEDASPGLVVAGPGQVTREDERRWQFSVDSARDFSLSIGADFEVLAVSLADGAQLELYTQGDSSAERAAAFWALDVARRSVNRFSALFGPMPARRLVIVEGDFPDGMEFSGLVFVSRDWFANWNGSPASYLTVITAHEVAHQWWYAAVGNDQARAPWLDEAMATYSEYLLLEADFPQLTNWWWDWRIDRFSPGGFVDGEVYGFASRREYINAVYLQGARLLHELRQDLGDDAFFAWLRQHATTHGGRIAGADDLWRLLDDVQLEATRATRRKYLRDPGP